MGASASVVKFSTLPATEDGPRGWAAFEHAEYRGDPELRARLLDSSPPFTRPRALAYCSPAAEL